jgi:CRP-like cAMP-binding protein
MTPFIALLNSIDPLSSELFQCLLERVKTKALARKTFLSREDEDFCGLYFIRSGLIRSYYHQGDEEICSWFKREGDFIILTPNSTQHVRNENIHVLESSIVEFITGDDLLYLYSNFSEFNFISRVLTERFYHQNAERLFLLSIHKAYDRYALMHEVFPEIVGRVSSAMIASYLGIAKETLSRIRGRKIRSFRRRLNTSFDRRRFK